MVAVDVAILATLLSILATLVGGAIALGRQLGRLEAAIDRAQGNLSIMRDRLVRLEEHVWEVGEP